MSNTEKYQNKYRIASNRWQFWDYSAPGSYFITICIKNRGCILGKIEKGIMYLSEYGKIAENEFLTFSEYHKRVLLDVHIVMPNHVHCIITLGDYDFDNGVSLVGGGNPVDKIHEFYLRKQPTPDEIKQYRKQRRKMVIPKILGKYQMQTSKQMNNFRQTPGQQNWQSDYHDHVIRDNDSYQRIKNYIINNPKNWKGDKFNNQK